MNSEQFTKAQSGAGFIAALDQSGGSTPKALKLYGVEEDAYSGDAEMFDMVHQMQDEGLGACTNHAECQDACPKEISIRFIGQMNRDYLRATLVEAIDRRGRMDSQ